MVLRTEATLDERGPSGVERMVIAGCKLRVPEIEPLGFPQLAVKGLARREFLRRLDVGALPVRPALVGALVAQAPLHIECQRRSRCEGKEEEGAPHFFTRRRMR